MASTAAEALDHARSTHIDAVVIDLDLPEGRQAGIDVTRRLRSLDGMAGLPVAIVADDGPLRARIAATHAGASLFATRPIGDSELVGGRCLYRGWQPCIPAAMYNSRAAVFWLTSSQGGDPELLRMPGSIPDHSGWWCDSNSAWPPIRVYETHGSGCEPDGFPRRCT